MQLVHPLQMFKKMETAPIQTKTTADKLGIKSNL